MGSTYVIQIGEDGPVKIGYTRGDPRTRQRQLQTASPQKLYLVRDFQGASGEAHLHRRFAQHRLLGEWFTNDVLLLLGGDMYGDER